MINGLKFVRVRPWDFNYVLTDEGRGFVEKLAGDLYKRFNSCVREIGEYVEKHYETHKMYGEGYHVMYELYSNGLPIFAESIRQLESIAGPGSFVQRLKRTLYSMEIDPPSLFDRFDQLTHHIYFFESLSGQPFRDDIPNWIKTLRVTYTYLQKNLNVYTFLHSLYSLVTTYPVVSNLDMYNVRNVSNFGQNRDLPGISLTRTNLAEFLDQYQIITNQYTPFPTDFEGHDLRYANQILELTVSKKISIDIVNTTMLAYGDFVQLSKLTRLSSGETRWFDDINELRVWAFHTLFVDDDIEKVDKQMKVVMVAPRLEVVGYRRFRLEGRNAKNRYKTANPLESGLAGLSGTSGGCIFGLFQTAVNANKLEITADGGRGGNAQDGGSGCFSTGCHGGKSGPGGPAGCIDIYINHQSLWPPPQAGKPGAPGKGGKGAVDGLSDHSTLYSDPPSYAVRIDIPREVNLYKARLRQTARTNPLEHDRLISFAEHIDHDPSLNTRYALREYVEEYEGLLNDVGGTETKFYDQFLHRVEAYAKGKTGDEATILNYLYSAVLSSKNLQGVGGGTLITDFPTYISIVLSDVETFQKDRSLTVLIEQRKKVANKFNQHLSDRIKQALDLLAHHVHPEMDQIGREIDETIRGLQQEIEQLQTNLKGEIRALEEKRRLLVIASVLKAIFGVMSIIGGVLTAIGGPLGLVGLGVSAASGVGNTLTDVFTQTQDIPQTALPKAIGNPRTGVGRRIGSKPSWRQKRGIPPPEIDSNTEYQDSTHVILLDERNRKAREIEKLSESINRSVTPSRKTAENGTEEYRKSYGVPPKSRRVRSFKDGASWLTKNEKGIETGLEAVEGVVPVGVEVYRTVQSIYEVDERIEEVKKKLEEVEQFSRYVNDTLTPLTKTIQDDIREFQSKLRGQSKAQLIVSRWRFQSTMREVQAYMRMVLEGFSASQGMRYALEKLEEVTSTFINLFDQIQEYEEQRELTDHIHELITQTGQDPLVGPEHSALLARLDETVKANVISQQYNLLLTNLERHYFPFNILNQLSTLLPPKNLSLPEHIRQISLKIGSVNKIYLQQSSTHNDIDQHIIKTTTSFYSWPPSEILPEVRNLFRGRKIFLKSDITRSRFNAWKANRLQIRFKTQEQTSLDRILSRYHLTLHHTGNSYYKCGKNYYVMSHDRVVFTYSLGGGDINQAADKISKASTGISPYALFGLQLIDTVNEPGQFSELEPYADKVVVELVGEGTYILNDQVCSQSGNLFQTVDSSTINWENGRVLYRESYGMYKERGGRYKEGGDRFKRSVPRPVSSGSSRLITPINALINWLRFPYEEFQSWFANRQDETSFMEEPDLEKLAKPDLGNLVKSDLESLIEPDMNSLVDSDLDNLIEPNPDNLIELDAVYSKPDMIYTKPDLVYPKPNMSLKPNIMYTNPDMIHSEPDMLSPEPNMVYLEPDMVYTKPDAVYPKSDIPSKPDLSSKPDIMYTNPDMLSLESDVVYSEPGMLSPEPDIAYSELDKIYTKPDVVYSKPDISSKSDVIEMMYPEPDILSLEPDLIYSEPYTIDTKPDVIHPESHSLYPEPDSLYPEPDPLYPESDSSYKEPKPDLKYMSNPSTFYHHVNNTLILGPVLLHLWKKIFHKTTNPTKTTPKSSKKLNTWSNLIALERTILDHLLFVDESQVRWYQDVFDTQKERLSALERSTQWDYTEVLEFEKSLVVFIVDLYEDVRYHEAFRGGDDRVVMERLKAALDMCRILPVYDRVYVPKREEYDRGYQYSNLMESHMNGFDSYVDSNMRIGGKVELNLIQ